MLNAPSFPWSVRELEQAFRIEDATGQAVEYTYFRKDKNEARQANVLIWDEASYWAGLGNKAGGGSAACKTVTGVHQKQ
jgi:hypothetical protein